MTLLDLYLNAVGLNLPKGSDRADILAELREHLETKMHERRAGFGRNLTEAEQQDVLTEYGEPFFVASRYGRSNRGFTFGPFQLMSPSAFRVFIGVLLFTLGINVIVALVEILLTGAPLVTLVRRIGVTMLVLFAVLTVAYAGIDYFLRRSAKTQRGAPEGWLFWTPYLKYIPRWYSASGLAVLGAVALGWGLWWSAWPDVPALFWGAAAEPIELSPSWQRHQLYLLGLLSLGLAQRAFSLVRPDFNSAPWVVRFAINALCVALLYPIFNSGPFLVVPNAAAAGVETVELAQSIERSTRGLIRGFAFYWVLNTLWIAFVCVGHLVYRAGRRRRRAVGEAQVSQE